MDSLLRIHHHNLRPLFLLPPPLLRQHPRAASNLVARADSSPSPASKDGRNSDELPAASSAADAAARKPADGKGVGFGRAAANSSVAAATSGKNKSKKVVRRSPIQGNSLLFSEDKGAQQQQQNQQPQQETANESAFLLTWLGLGSLILVEGIALAASGFLPEEWDSFFVKFLYPSFTPTVFLFIGGTVAYGVFKYLQAEKMKN